MWFAGCLSCGAASVCVLSSPDHLRCPSSDTPQHNLHTRCCQVDALVSYGITYSFPLDDDSSDEAAAAAAGGVGQRPAPLAPSIDTLHTYNALPQLVARFLGGGGSSMSSSVRAPKPGWSHRSMPLMLRQSLAQRISTAVITRLEQVRVWGGGVRVYCAYQR